jgi:phage terminase small subunit
MALNARQQLFVAHYLKHKNATEAAKAAGYSAKSAYSTSSRMLENAEIKAAIQEKVQNLVDKLGIGPEYVLNSLKEVAERCKQGIPVEEFDPVSKQMVKTGEWKFEHQGANKALELIGKFQKMWTDKTEHSLDPNIASVLDRFDD